MPKSTTAPSHASRWRSTSPSTRTALPPRRPRSLQPADQILQAADQIPPHLERPPSSHPKWHPAQSSSPVAVGPRQSRRIQRRARAFWRFRRRRNRRRAPNAPRAAYLAATLDGGGAGPASPSRRIARRPRPRRGLRVCRFRLASSKLLWVDRLGRTPAPRPYASSGSPPSRWVEGGGGRLVERRRHKERMRWIIRVHRRKQTPRARRLSPVGRRRTTCSLALGTPLLRTRRLKTGRTCGTARERGRRTPRARRPPLT
mmetsp:Transcript_16420/g.55424  ORF Transcript_16420/g.55424 Transcript_16420/m.55424 type:complete len:258 (+) Transcript_16420:1917-2690(+)